METLSLTKFGVTLTRLERDSIEYVRRLRNSPEITQFMRHREIITPEMQSAWFDRIDPKSDYYFLIHFQGEKAGLVDVKKIDWALKRSLGGIFVEEKFRNTDVPFRASLCAMDFAFYRLGLEYSEITVLKSNSKAIRYGKALGYAQTDLPEGPMGEQIWRVTRSQWEKATDTLRSYLGRESA